MFQEDGIDTQKIAVIGIFGAIVAFVLIVGAQVLYYRMSKADDYAKRVMVGSTELREVQSEQRSQINAYHWVNKDKDIVAVPIERAMEIELRTLQQQKK